MATGEKNSHDSQEKQIMNEVASQRARAMGQCEAIICLSRQTCQHSGIELPNPQHQAECPCVCVCVCVREREREREKRASMVTRVCAQILGRKNVHKIREMEIIA